MRRRVLTVVLVVPILMMSACGGGDADPDVPATSPRPSTSATPAETGSPAPTATAAPTGVPRPASTAEAAKLSVAVLGKNAARTPDEKAVVEAWMTYWDAVTQTYDTLEAAPGLDSASGKPLSQVLDYLDKLRTRNHRSVGWTRDNVLNVAVSGDDAALRDCVENFSFEVDASNEPTEKPSPFYVTIGQLTKKGGRWIVRAIDNAPTETDCRS